MTAAATIALPATPEAVVSAPAPSRYGRVVSIDILRGLALLWVMTFHLWGDMVGYGTRDHLYPALRTAVLHGDVGLFTRVAEILMANGNLGVELFMMLSGVSLTMNAYHRGEPAALTGYRKRFKRVLPVYWFGILFALATVGTLAALRAWQYGGSPASQWPHVYIAAIGHVRIDWTDVMLGASVVGWPFRMSGLNTPALLGSLWFVELLCAYYLLFPLALRLERRVGPWAFAVLGLAFMLIARAALVPWTHETPGNVNQLRLLTALAPFRIGEFTIGMSVGHLLAARRDDVAGWLRSPADTVGIVFAGIALCLTGVLIQTKGDVAFIVSEALVDVGLALTIAPLLFKMPGRLEGTIVAQGLILIGVVSFTALITDDMMRWIASYLRDEGVTGPVWWFFLVVVYVPVGVALAYPLAKLFGLLPSQRDPQRNNAGGPPKPPSAPVRAGRRRPPRSTRRREARAARA